MEEQKNIWSMTLLLTIIAGYCDTVTFVAADSIFSAHVTGNFIVFAYQIIKGSDVHAWIKLLTFPVFIIAVMVGGKIAMKNTSHYTILFWEGFLLSLSGAVSFAFGYVGYSSQWTVYVIAMSTVFAMGLQNAFGKLYSKETIGPTTMMTGNVTQASLDLGNIISKGWKNIEVIISFKRQLATIFGFLIGCFLGAIAGKFLGLDTLIIPGAAMIICYWKNNKT